MSNAKKYIVRYSERSIGPQCNEDAAFLVESIIEPTERMIIKNGLAHPGRCTNITYPGCEECPGSTITSFTVEPFSIERSVELGLEKDSRIYSLK